VSFTPRQITRLQFAMSGHPSGTLGMGREPGFLRYWLGSVVLGGRASSTPKVAKAIAFLWSNIQAGVAGPGLPCASESSPCPALPKPVCSFRVQDLPTRPTSSLKGLPLETGKRVMIIRHRRADFAWVSGIRLHAKVKRSHLYPAASALRDRVGVCA